MSVVLAFKLTLTPILILAATLAARRWGPMAGGLVAGLPLTSGPIAAFLYVEQGAGFTAAAAVGTILGLVAVVVFAIAFAWAARARGRLGGALLAGLGAYIIAVALLRALPPLHWVIAVLLTWGTVTVAILLFPTAGGDEEVRTRPRWELPARMAAATAMVLALTESARLLGPALTGLLSPFPVFAAVMAGFALAHEGRSAAIAVLRGVLLSTYGFAAFFGVLAVGLEATGPFAFVIATAVAVLIGALAAFLFARLRRRRAG